MLQPGLLCQSIHRNRLRKLIGSIAYQQESLSTPTIDPRDRDRVGQVTPSNLHCIG